MKRLAILIVLLATTASAQDIYTMPRRYGTQTPWQQPYGYRYRSSYQPSMNYLQPYHSSYYNGGYSPGYYVPPTYQYHGGGNYGGGNYGRWNRSW